MNVAWALFWGGSRSTKPCVFPCKVAAADDERYLVCAAGAAGAVPDAIGSSPLFCNEWLCLCAWFSAFLEAVVADRNMNYAWAIFRGGNRSTKPSVFFRVKWLQPTMKGTSSVRRGRLGSFRTRSVPPLCSAMSGCVSVCVVLCVA